MRVCECVRVYMRMMNESQRCILISRYYLSRAYNELNALMTVGTTVNGAVRMRIKVNERSLRKR